MQAYDYVACGFDRADVVICIGYRVEKAQELTAILEKAFDDKAVVIIDVAVDYSENIKLAEKLGQLVCPV